MSTGAVEEVWHHAAAIHGNCAQIQLQAAAQGADTLIGHRIGQNDIFGTRHAAEDAGEPVLRTVGKDDTGRITTPGNSRQPRGGSLAGPGWPLGRMEILQCRVTPIFRQLRQQTSESGEIGLGGRPIDRKIDEPGLFCGSRLEARIGRLRHNDRAPPRPTFHQAALLKRREGARDRGQIDAENARDVALRRQLVADHQLSARDSLGDRGGQLSVDGLAVLGELDILDHTAQQNV